MGSEKFIIYVEEVCGLFVKLIFFEDESDDDWFDVVRQFVDFFFEDVVVMGEILGVVLFCILFELFEGIIEVICGSMVMMIGDELIVWLENWILCVKVVVIRVLLGCFVWMISFLDLLELGEFVVSNLVLD